MAFNGVGGFSCGVWARPGTAVSERMIGAINQLGNEFILIFLFVAQAWSSRMIGLFLASALSENDFHPVVGNTRFEAGGHVQSRSRERRVSVELRQMSRSTLAFHPPSVFSTRKSCSVTAFTSARC